MPSYVDSRPWGKQKPPLGFGIDRSHPLARGLVGCWLFNEGAGGRANDIAGVRHGTVAGNIWSAGGITTTSTSMISLPAIPLVPPYSLCLSYIYTASNSNYLTYIGSINNDEYYGASSFNVSLNAGKPRMNLIGLWTAILAVAPNIGSQVDLTVNVYRIGVVTFTDAYVNGVLAVSANYDYGGADTTTGTYGSMWNRPDGTKPFGNIGVRQSLYSRALSASEVAQLYQEPYCFVEGWNYARYYSLPTGAAWFAARNQSIIDGAPFGGVAI